MFHRVAFSYFVDPYRHKWVDAIGSGFLGTSTWSAPSHLTWEAPKGDRS
jgi:hypothetical protein